MLSLGMVLNTSSQRCTDPVRILKEEIKALLVFGCLLGGINYLQSRAN